jgi:hypothetical protein
MPVTARIVFSMPKLPTKQVVNTIARSLFLVALVMFATEKEARAYTDPGTGALIWQMLVAGLVGVGFYFRRITSWFRSRKGSKD